VTEYTVHVTRQAWKEIKDLPGKIRQRVRKAVNGLAEKPRPSKSKRLDLPDLPFEVWRLRLDNWRLLYAITDTDLIVDVLAARKRPPYDYGDLAALLEHMLPPEE
jgi:mRNA interferase RelE/StbE